MCYKSGRFTLMKKPFFLPLLLTAVLLSGIAACKKTCQTGYEDPGCSIETRAEFENLNYTVTESMNGDSAYSYPATIIAGAGPLQILLTGVGNGAIVNNVTGIVSSDTLTIARQAPDSNAHYIQGSGILSGNQLTINYTITYPDSLPVLHTQVDQYYSQWVHP
jgi:hypothetical protein